MHFKLLLILTASLLNAQTYYESLNGIDFNSYNARGLSMGSSSNIVDRSALSILVNPSNISLLEEQGVFISSSYFGNSNLERRGIIIKDSFEDNLAETDYVKNSNFFSSLAFGIKYVRKINSNLNFALAASSVPFKSYNYNYKEEVRGSASNLGPTSRDPLLGYHNIESEGIQTLSNFGSSLSFISDGITLSFGLSVNYINSISVSEEVSIDKVTSDGDPDDNYFSNIIPYKVVYQLGSDEFLTFGHSIKFDRYLLSFSLQSPSTIRKKFLSGNDSSYFSFNSTNSTISFLELYPEESIIKQYLDNYLEIKLNNIQNPEKYNVGFSVLNPEKSNFNFIFNYEFYKHKESYILKSYNRYSIGIEHYTFQGTPLRFGIEYKTSPFKPYVASISSFSAGSGFKISSLVFDYGVKYSQFKYNFPDLFPVINNLFYELDTVNESCLDFIGTVTYQF